MIYDAMQLFGAAFVFCSLSFYSGIKSRDLIADRKNSLQEERPDVFFHDVQLFTKIYSLIKRNLRNPFYGENKSYIASRGWSTFGLASSGGRFAAVELISSSTQCTKSRLATMTSIESAWNGLMDPNMERYCNFEAN